MPDKNSLPCPIPNTYWVVPSQFLAGEYPGAPVDALTRQKLQAMLQGGVTHFVDLTEPGELVPYESLLHEQAAQLGVAAFYVRLPITDVSVPRTPREMASILDAVDNAVAEGGTVFLHCWGGSGARGPSSGAGSYGMGSPATTPWPNSAGGGKAWRRRTANLHRPKRPSSTPMFATGKSRSPNPHPTTPSLIVLLSNP